MIYIQYESHRDYEYYSFSDIHNYKDYSFSNIHRAVKYILDEHITKFSLSDFPIIEEDYYTYIED